jgi:hypothetical protein
MVNNMLTPRRHFHSLLNSASFPNGMLRDIFLVIDSETVMSYTKPANNAAKPAKDRGGYLLAIDAQFNPHIADPRAFESPGYQGQVHVLGSLLWYDVYALLVGRTQDLKDLWPLAMGHPMKVYVGPTVALQHAAWEEEHQIKNMLNAGFFDFLRKKEQEGTL